MTISETHIHMETLMSYEGPHESFYLIVATIVHQVEKMLDINEIEKVLTDFFKSQTISDEDGLTCLVEEDLTKVKSRRSGAESRVWSALPLCRPFLGVIVCCGNYQLASGFYKSLKANDHPQEVFHLRSMVVLSPMLLMPTSG